MTLITDSESIDHQERPLRGRFRLPPTGGSVITAHRRRQSEAARDSGKVRLEGGGAWWMALQR